MKMQVWLTGMATMTTVPNVLTRLDGITRLNHDTARCQVGIKTIFVFSMLNNNVIASNMPVS